CTETTSSITGLDRTSSAARRARASPSSDPSTSSSKRLPWRTSVIPVRPSRGSAAATALPCGSRISGFGMTSTTTRAISEDSCYCAAYGRSERGDDTILPGPRALVVRRARGLLAEHPKMAGVNPRHPPFVRVRGGAGEGHAPVGSAQPSPSELQPGDALVGLHVARAGAPHHVLGQRRRRRVAGPVPPGCG